MSDTQTIIKTKPSLLKRLVNYIGCIVIVLSLLFNFYLIVAVASLQGDNVNRAIVKDGQEESIVAAFKIEGVINAETAARFNEFYHAVHKDKAVKAILLRVDSPGGTVSASEQIGHQIGKLKKAGKKIVISMGAVAASGGYLISANADHIVAENSTITGSIGVVAPIPNCSALMEKLGVKMQYIKSSDARVWKDMLNPFRAPQKFELDRMISILNQMQTSFNAIVKNGRGDKLKLEKEIVTISSINEKGEIVEKQIEQTAPLNGKIYTAIEAKKFGLIDQIGFEDTAIEVACKLAGNPNSKVIRYSFESTADLLRAIIFGKSSLPKVATEFIDANTKVRFMMIWNPTLFSK